MALISAFVNLFAPFGSFLQSPITFKAVVATGYSAEKLLKLNNAIIVYYKVFHKVAPSLNEVVNSGLVKRNDVIDPWGKEYQYEVYDECFSLKGADENGKIRKELYILQFLFLMQPDEKVTVPKAKEPEIQVVE